MFSRHVGLRVFLLLGVAGQAELLEHFTGRSEPAWSLGLMGIIGSMIAVLLGQWIADDSVRPRWRSLGWGIAAAGAGLHLLLDVSCVALLWLPVKHGAWLLAGVAVAAMVMLVQLVLAIGGLRDPTRPAPLVATGRGRLGAVVREASLFGGTALAVTAVGAGMLALAVAAVSRRGWSGKIGGAMLFFALCAVVGICMGIERRAALLERPVPWARWLPRLRRHRYHAVREGLLLEGRREAVLYRWEDVATVGLGAVNGNQAVLVTLVAGAVGQHVRATDLTPEGDARWRRRQARGHAVVRALYGADLVILSLQTASGPGPLHAQLAAALDDAAAARALPPMTDVLSEG